MRRDFHRSRPLSSRSDAHRARCGDAGDTLVEVLLAVVVLGLCSMALMLGFGTSINGSSEYRSIATVDTVLRTAVEEATSAIQQNASVAFACPDTYVVSFNPALPTGYSGTVSSVKYWNGSAFTSTCQAAQPQLIAVSVTYSGATYSISTVVDDPLARSIATPGASTKLVFVGQPGNGVAAQTLSSPPVVAIEDASGNIVTTDLSAVSLTLTAQPSPNGATLSPSCTGDWYAGVVTFDNCSVGTVGSYILTATDGSLTPATSASFSVSFGPASAAQSSVTANPTSVASNGTSSSTITVTLEDAEGNVIPGKTISLSAGSGSSTITIGTDPTNASGVATFSVSDASAQSVTYTATDSTDSVTISATAAVNFLPGPTPTITNPAASTVYSAAATNIWSGIITGTATDGVGPGVASIAVEIQATSGPNTGNYWNGTASSWQSAAIFNGATGTASWHYSFAIPADGNYTFTAQGTDTGGVVGNPVSVSTLFDSTPPTASAPIVNGHP